MAKVPQESKNFYKKIVNHLPVGVGIAGFDGKVMIYNNKLPEVMGYSNDDFSRMSIKDTYLNPGDREILLKKIKENGYVENFETQLKHKNGDVYYAQLNVCRFDVKGNKCLLTVVQDDSKRKKIEIELLKRKQELEEMNSALEVLLRKREADKIDLEKKVLSNIKTLILPYLEKLKTITRDEQQRIYLKLIESNFKDILSPMSLRLKTDFDSLTPTEIKISDFIKNGATNKEIADLLNVTVKTIEFHRHNIRKKLGIKNKKVNLRSRLLSLN